tara:strand:+ start:298 stop:1896 length:1599 start_codon:yes stop_codon:yes gene_type:complete
MNSNKTVTANFVKKKYALTTVVEGEGTISEKVIKAGAATDYNSGTVVELTATPSTRWRFKEWAEDLTGTDNPVQITMDKAKTVKAVFESIPHFYLDENGVTIKANDWVTAGITGELNGVTYTAVDNNTLKSMADDDDFTKVVTTLVDDMTGIFSRNNDFNQDISSWDVSNVIDMNNMFSGTTSFNQDIGNWNVSNVTDMSTMFGASFNQDIGNWDVSKVTNMDSMFGEAFNNGGSGSIGDWDVSNVTNMNYLFFNSAFNQPIGNWDVDKVINMYYMFGRSAFNQDIGSWNVKNVVKMSYMFAESPFNQDIGNWDVTNVEEMEFMFSSAKYFNQDIGNWNVENVEKMGSMFMSTEAFNQNLTKWCVTNIQTEPSNFSSFGSALTEANKPVWGTCPSSGSNVWTGTNMTFTKGDQSDPTMESNQDRITDNVWITRPNKKEDGKNGYGQIYNIKEESKPDENNSPVGTKWAVGTIDQIESLTFKKFRAAVGKPKNVVGKNLVMYLEIDDVYLTVKFTSWSQGEKGGFAYERSTKP